MYTHYSPDDVILRCFKELTLSQRLIKSERPEPRKFSFYFSAPADSLPLLKGLNFDETDAFIVEKPTGRIDTLQYWIRDSLVYQMDTQMCIRDRHLRYDAECGLLPDACVAVQLH